MEPFAFSPEEAARGRTVPDRYLPMLAAEWLANGWDSPALRELAGLTVKDVNEVGELFEDAMDELGFRQRRSFRDPYDPAWLGHWDQIANYVSDMDVLASPYATAQRVIELASETPGLWEPCHCDQLQELLHQWRMREVERGLIGQKVRQILRSITEDSIRLSSEEFDQGPRSSAVPNHHLISPGSVNPTKSSGFWFLVAWLAGGTAGIALVRLTGVWWVYNNPIDADGGSGTYVDVAAAFTSVWLLAVPLAFLTLRRARTATSRVLGIGGAVLIAVVCCWLSITWSFGIA